MSERFAASFWDLLLLAVQWFALARKLVGGR
jgi:hypothetical protein